MPEIHRRCPKAWLQSSLELPIFSSKGSMGVLATEAFYGHQAAAKQAYRRTYAGHPRFCFEVIEAVPRVKPSRQFPATAFTGLRFLAAPDATQEDTTSSGGFHLVFFIFQCRWLATEVQGYWEYMQSKSNWADDISRLGFQDPWWRRRQFQKEEKEEDKTAAEAKEDDPAGSLGKRHEALGIRSRSSILRTHSFEPATDGQNTWEETSDLLCDPCPLVLDPLFTVQELYITLKVARKDMAYITGKGVLLGRVGFKDRTGHVVAVLQLEELTLHKADLDLMEGLLYLVKVTDQSLKHTLEFGIGIHHAGLPERDRKVVEELFVEAKIMVLISTSTLAWGVNFPAHLVIIKGTEYYDGQLKRYVDFPITDVLQMMGRAGRPQFDTEARAVVMVHEPKKNFYRRFIYEPFPVESSLHEQLTDHLNAEIVAKTIRTREEAIDYVTWTYFFRRLTANPAYYDQQAALLETPDFEKQKDMLANYIERLMNKCLDELIRSGCIELKEAQQAPQGLNSALVEPTKLGRIASLYYLSHRTVAQFQRTLAREGMSFVEIMRVLCECPEYDELPVRHNEDKLNAEFAEHCPLEVDLAIQAYDSPHTKAFLLLQAHMWGIALPINDYKTDLKSVLDRSIPLIMAMVDIAAEEAQLRSTLNLILLLQCLHQAHQPWRSSLATLPHLSDKALRILRDMGVDSLPELIERRDASKILTKLSLPSADAHKELLQIVQDMPRLRMRVELRILDPEEPKEESQQPEPEDGKVKRRKGKLVPSPYKVPPDRELELTVVLCYDNEPMKFVHAPRFPKKKTYSWWCILGDTEVDELVSIKKALMPTRQRFEKRISFQFCSPADEVGETFTLSVLCMSDSFFGLDQQLDLSITTAEPEAV
eukprot:s2041_g5.t1